MATVAITPPTIIDIHLDEPRELQRIVTRLIEQYPAAGETVVRDVVATSLHVFDDATVRKFVPLLVERLARQALNQRRVIDLDEPAG
jgi:hypothetical protein